MVWTLVSVLVNYNNSNIFIIISSSSSSSIYLKI